MYIYSKTRIWCTKTKQVRVPAEINVLDQKYMYVRVYIYIVCVEQCYEVVLVPVQSSLSLACRTINSQLKTRLDQ